MGGVAILVAMLLGYAVAHVFTALTSADSEGPTASGLLVLFLATGLGLVALDRHVSWWPDTDQPFRNVSL